MVAPTSITLSEWEERSPDSDERLSSLVLDAQARQLAEDLSGAMMLDVTELRTGISVQAYSHVGKIHLGDLEITILPKLKQASLLNLLRYAYGFRKLRLFSESSQLLEKAGFEDLLISQLNAEVAELISRGLHRNYIPQGEYLASPRGRINLQQVANDGGVVAACLPCIHHPRIEDTLLNRVLLAGLTLAGGIAADIRLRRESRRLAATFVDFVGEIRLDATVFQCLSHRMNRLTVAYEPAISLIRLLYESQGVSFEGSELARRIPGFLFDMNRFFQALLSRFLGEHLPDYTVRDEFRLRDMMSYVPKFNPRNRRSPSPRPDFVVLKGQQAESILDAKYRDLWERSLPRDMLYQLAIYATIHKKNVATILYPTTDTKATEARVDVRDPLYGTDIAQVRLRPVILDTIEQLVLSETSAKASRQKAAYARWLAFG